MRCARGIVALLVAGALVSIGVAWTIGAFAAFPGPVAGVGDPRAGRLVWPAPPPRGWGQPDHGGRGHSFGLTARWAAENWAAWSYWKPGDPAVVRRSMLVNEYGWPARCLRSRWLSVAPRDAVRSGNTLQPVAVGLWRSGWPVPDRLNPQNRAYRRWALEPKPLGLATNTALYALVVGALWTMPRWVRARWRTRRGRCAGCGYPLGGEVVCPECGRPPGIGNAPERRTREAAGVRV